MSDTTNLQKHERKEVPVLLTSVLIIALCGILYELLISTISTYFLGSSILHFSITIGLFLSAIGLGSFFSRFIYRNLLDKFIKIEIWLGVIGGFSALILYLAFSLTHNYYLLTFILISVLGCLIGLEIPILMRILKKYDNLKNTISNVLAFDYIGSLVASIFFPLILLPYLGIMRVSFLIGILNVSIAILNTHIFRTRILNYKKLLLIGYFSIILMIIGFAYSLKVSNILEQFIYEDEILFSKQSEYQKIVLTKHNEDIRLYINDNLQFSTIDEYRYHETMVHIPVNLLLNGEDVLVLGGGDGLVARELLKYPESKIKNIDLVDLDPSIIEVAKQSILSKINESSLSNPRVKVINQDAYNYVLNSNKIYSLIIIDLPDPNSPSLGKLYSHEFYQLTKKILSIDGILITQSTSPYYAIKPFWCIHKTLEGVFTDVIPINVYLPTLGIWGFNIAFRSKQKRFYDEKSQFSRSLLLDKLSKELQEQEGLLNNRFLTSSSLQKIFIFPKDMQLGNIKIEINRLDNQALVRYYENSWSKWE